MIICAGNAETFSFAKSIGIGLVNVAIELTQICLQYAPKKILFIGSAGSYDSTIKIGTLFYSTSATNIELSFLQNQSYTPIHNSISIENPQRNHHTTDSIQPVESNSKKQQETASSLRRVSHETYFSLPENLQQAIVNSSNYITNTCAFNDMMLRANILLENMEAFSVFKVAQYFRIPSIAILCVSNIVGENAHQQWLDNQILVQHTLTDFIANHYNK